MNGEWVAIGALRNLHGLDRIMGVLHCLYFDVFDGMWQEQLIDDLKRFVRCPDGNERGHI